MDLSGRVALVTGASRGIGEATARTLAAAGATVVLAARSTEAIEATADAIRAEGGHAEPVVCDMAEAEDVDAAVAMAEGLGPLDVLVNNAGVIEPIGPLAGTDAEAWTLAIDINLKGPYRAIRRALPGMTARGRGTIVNISSGAASNPLDGWSAYCTSKAGLAMLTRMVDKEAGPHGIRAIGLSPGTVATEMQRVIKASGVGPVSQLDWSDHIPPEWPARAILWLCGEAGTEHAGQEVSLRREEIRRAVGLI
ncbi:MAG: SDR family NAD(P)-dependent oxidoreductase [Paracoccaceae bacterium]